MAVQVGQVNRKSDTAVFGDDDKWMAPFRGFIASRSDDPLADERLEFLFYLLLKGQRDASRCVNCEGDSSLLKMDPHWWTGHSLERGMFEVLF